MNGGFFVYIYKDKKQNIQYVGYGKNSKRAISHQAKTHNKSLEELIESGGYSVHIAVCNKKQEKKEWRFRPIGVKPELTFRLAEAPLQLSDLLIDNKKILFVRISNINFSDRVGYDISTPPNDSAIVARVKKYWQLNKYIPQWAENPSESPSLLVGVIGSPGSQIIISSMEIDINKWDDLDVHKGGLVEVPLKNAQELDMHDLRGRKIDKSVGLKFGGIRSQFFRIFPES